MSVQLTHIANDNIPRNIHPDILLLMRYWRYIHLDGRMPGRSHFLLNDIPGLCPHLRLLDVVEGGAFRYRVRMIGKEHKRQLGFDPCGAWYETITDQFENSVVERDLLRVLSEKRPVYRKGETIVPYVSGSKRIERVHVPLASDGVNVNAIATLTLFSTTLRPYSGAQFSAQQEELRGRHTVQRDRRR